MSHKEISENYKLGYRTGFKMAVLFLMKYCDDDKLIDKLIADYNNHPLIGKLSAKEISK